MGRKKSESNWFHATAERICSGKEAAAVRRGSERVSGGKDSKPRSDWTGMGRKKVASAPPFWRWTGIGRKNVVSMSIMSTFLFCFWMNGHQNGAFSCLIGALKNPRKVNGHGADYAVDRVQFWKTASRVVRFLFQHYERIIGRQLWCYWKIGHIFFWGTACTIIDLIFRLNNSNFF